MDPNSRYRPVLAHACCCRRNRTSKESQPSIYMEGETTKNPTESVAGAVSAPSSDSVKAAAGDGNETTSEETGKPKKEKKIPEGLVIPPKKPKLTKAERRALQEQQRAAKGAGQQGEGRGGGGPKKQPSQQSKGEQQQQGGSKEGVGGQPPVNKGSDGKKGSGSTGERDPLENNSRATTSSSSTEHQQRQQQQQFPITLVSTLAPYRNPSEIFNHGALLRPNVTKERLHWHPAVVALGYKYATGEVRGGNARCRHMLACFETVLNDFTPQPSAAVESSAPPVDSRHILDQLILKSSFQFWTEQCRPHSVSMGNAFTALKAAVASLDRTLSFAEMKCILLETISAYCRERIDYADRAIADLAHQKLFQSSRPSVVGGGVCGSLKEHREEVILTYGYSEVVDLTLRQAATEEEKSTFRVIVVDSQPLLEGRRLLSQLRKYAPQIECTYVLLHALTYVLQDVTKVVMGASALMSDGSVWGRAGSACVALAAHAEHIPVLVCSETYKISNRVQLESLTSNELGSPYDAVSAADEGTTNARSTSDAKPAMTPHHKNLKQLNLLYDLTPASFVSGIVTELGIIPPSSVAVLLRELNQQEG